MSEPKVAPQKAQLDRLTERFTDAGAESASSRFEDTKHTITLTLAEDKIDSFLDKLCEKRTTTNAEEKKQRYER